MNPPFPTPIAIACGGTGGHLFPGVAVADILQQWGCDVALLVSKKEVDQEAVKAAVGMQIIALPAVALNAWKWPSFVRGSWQSYRLCRKHFSQLRPRAVLAMGGFTSAPPVLAGKSFGAATFLHESNSIPGRANRWLSPWVDEIFVGFPTAPRRLYNQTVRVVGTPVRSTFVPTDPAACRMALGLQTNRPVLLIMGGSQGARPINRLMQGALPLLAGKTPELQYLHLTGADDADSVRAAYAAQNCRAVVRPFLSEMELGLGAATIAVNRAGASSLAELAAMRLPALLIPYPHATDDHQLHNARAMMESGAARLLEQRLANPEALAEAITSLLTDAAAREAMQRALQRWSRPKAAEDIAAGIFQRIGLSKPDLPPEDGSFRLPGAQSGAAKPWDRAKFGLAAAPSK